VWVWVGVTHTHTHTHTHILIEGDVFPPSVYLKARGQYHSQTSCQLFNKLQREKTTTKGRAEAMLHYPLNMTQR